MSWFRSVLDLAGRVFSREDEDFAVAKLGPARGITNLSERVEKDKDYVTIKVKSSRIIDVRRWTSTFYGSV
jgi:hypothetical protein